MKNNNKEELDKRFLEDFGMTYEEFDQLDLHTQLELISKKQEEKKQQVSLVKRLVNKIKKH